ncbi:PIN domain nuclease [Nocardioides immobilis]|uniref:PIN domain nuclease n=2 Tax=Nocardioides immobilis TaxID=2049295 RepID=A0A417Y057_9ACTN|nr:PIN domain nuclease [Nocardioides immobilis]
MIVDLTLDAGALIAIERGDSTVRSMVDQALADGRAIHVVPGVLAQVWRGGPRQARLAAFMDQSEVTLGNLDPDTAKAVGVLIGLTGHADVVDVHVALHARLHGHAVMTSDPDDIRAVDPSLSLIEV